MTRTRLTGARVITMASGRPDAEHIDILIDGDQIAELGTERTDAEIVDLTGRIVMPGLVNAHLHTWQAALRCMGSDWTLLEYLNNVHNTIADRYRPDDTHVGTLVGALNQINCGTTTLGDWSHNTPTPEHTDAAIDALRDAGIRAVFLDGSSYRKPTAASARDIDRLLDGTFSRDGLVTLGMAIKGPQYSAPDVALTDLQTAADRDLLVSMHQSGGPLGPAWNNASDAGLLGPRCNIVHAADMTQDWVASLLDLGATFTVTPESELGQGPGVPVTDRLLRHGAAPSLGTDMDSVVPGEILTAARIALAHQRHLDHERHRLDFASLAATASVTTKQALQWATIEGARALGLADRVGHIAPGMQADLIVIDARNVNLWPAHDPLAAALHANVANIEAVMIAGQWRKRDHHLVDVDLDDVQARVLESSHRLLHGETTT